jgi:hypothetical protein
MAWYVVRRTAVTALAMLTVLLLFGAKPALAAETGPGERPAQLTPNQLRGGRTLTLQEALAACGPAAAVAFAEATGKPLTLDAAVAAARDVGWSPARGMTGPYGQALLLRRLSIPSTVEAGLDPARIKSEVAAGRPVIIRTSGQGASRPGHYFVAERIDPTTGRLDLAQSALVLRASGGRRWFSLNEISSLGVGSPTHAIYLAQGARTAGASVSAQAAAASTLASARPGAARSGAQIVAAGGLGARLRAAPSTAAKIVGLVSDGTRLTDTGATAVAAGRTWRRVTTADGGTAWIDAGLVRAS